MFAVRHSLIHLYLAAALSSQLASRFSIGTPPNSYEVASLNALDAQSDKVDNIALNSVRNFGGATRCSSPHPTASRQFILAGTVGR